MLTLWREFADFFSSLKLTVFLLACSIVLVLAATLDQVNLGIWAVQEKYFRTLIVLWRLPGTDVPVPVFPGGYFVGGLLLINLVAAHVRRLKLVWSKFGLHLTHGGLILLLLGELFTGLFAVESQLRLDEGQTKNYVEDFHARELAIIETTPADHDSVVAIPVAHLARLQPLAHERLPFTVHPRSYYANAELRMRRDVADAPPSPASQGIGPQIDVRPAGLTFRPDEQNLPTTFLELRRDGQSLGTWLVSLALPAPQTVTVDGRTFVLELRATRYYQPFSLTLQDFSHDKYPGTEIPKNFSSLVRVQDPARGEDRTALIYMNNPLRYGGLTFYQAGFDNNDTTSVLQVVRNPSWLIPYLSCALMTLGLLWHFLLHLSRFMQRRRPAPAVPVAA